MNNLLEGPVRSSLIGLLAKVSANTYKNDTAKYQSQINISKSVIAYQKKQSDSK